MRERLLRNKVICSWCMYDWANSAFATTIMAALFPVYYGSVAGAHLPGVTITSYWGYTNTICMLIVAIFAPVLGAIADQRAIRKKFLAGFTGLGILFTALLGILDQGEWFLASILYIFAYMGYGGANIFYDSFLPHIAGPRQIDRISAWGYALGYLGGGLLLLLNLIMILKPHFFGISDWVMGFKISFLSVSLWWALFSIPIMRNVAEPPAFFMGADDTNNSLKAGFRRLSNTFKDIRKYREIFKFLFSYWLYNDGINTIIRMAAIFGTEINIAREHIIGAIIAVQFIGFPFSIIFGWIARFIGTRNSILLGLGIYTLIAIKGYFIQTPLDFWILAILVGFTQGGTQALSRSLFGAMIPREKAAEFFGFYDVSSKFAGIFGPLLFGLTGQLTGSSRMGIIALIVFFISGGIILTRVDTTTHHV